MAQLPCQAPDCPGPCLALPQLAPPPRVTHGPVAAALVCAMHSCAHDEHLSRRPPCAHSSQGMIWASPKASFLAPWLLFPAERVDTCQPLRKVLDRLTLGFHIRIKQ